MALDTLSKQNTKLYAGVTEVQAPVDITPAELANEFAVLLNARALASRGDLEGKSEDLEAAKTQLTELARGGTVLNVEAIKAIEGLFPSEKSLATSLKDELKKSRPELERVIAAQ